MHTLICTCCNKQFKAKRSDAKYCGFICRRKEWRHRQAAKSFINQEFPVELLGDYAQFLGEPVNG